MKLRVGVIPAAGRGSRISDLPLTRILPKPMLPLLHKPILEYVIENMKKFGVKTIYMIVGYKKEIIQEYFRNGEDWDIDIIYIEQKKLKGIAHAISLVSDYINEPFVVILGDDLTISSSFDNMIRLFKNRHAYVVEGVVIENNVNVLKDTCAVVIDSDNRIIEIEEKPRNPKSNLRGTGIYIFHPVVFDYIKRTPISKRRFEREITDTINIMAREGKAYGVLINGINININTMRELLYATKILIAKFKNSYHPYDYLSEQKNVDKHRG